MSFLNPLRAGTLVLTCLSLATGCANWPVSLGGDPPKAWELPPAEPAEGPIVPAGAFSEMQLENGLTILVLEDHRLPRVALGLELRRGAGSVDPSLAGVAAITSELMQRGAGDRDTLELARVVEDAGASLSVSADWDTTGVSLAGLSEDRALLFEILGDVTLRPRFDPEEFDRVLAEHQASLVAAQDDPSTLVGWNAVRVLYEGHRYGLPVSGTADSVATIELDDARAYWRDRFVPGDAIFWAVGDVDAETIKTEVEALFGDLVDRPAPPNTPATPERTPEARRIVVVDKPDLGQARIIVAHEGIARNDPHRLALSLMNDTLGGSGFSSRLMMRVRAEEGLTYGVSSGFSLRSVPGPFSISTFTRNEKVREVVDLLLEEMEAIRETRPVTPEERAKFVSYNVGRFGLSLETSESVLASLVDLRVHDLPADSLDTYRSRIRALTLDEIRASARDYLHPDRAAIVLLGPAENLVPQLEGLGVDEVEVWQP